MQKILNIQENSRWKVYVGVMLVASVVLLLTTIVPVWNWIPTQITEEGTVLTMTENGCVIAVPTMNYPIIQECNAQPGDLISVTYYVPGKMINDYYDRMQDKVELVQP